MKKEEKKNNLLDKLIIFIFILIGVGLFGYTYYVAKDSLSKQDNTKKELRSLELYGYKLSDTDTELFSNTFKELEMVLNEDTIDYSKYAELLSKLFIIDVYTLNNKLTSTDIGGLDFLHKDLKENFKDNLGATLYKNVENNLDGNRTQKLPEVIAINTNEIKETKYIYNNEEYEGYIVSLSWEYVEDLGYEKSAKITLIKDNGKLYIVKGE
jgi:hypothetical protein